MRIATVLPATVLSLVAFAQDAPVIKVTTRQVEVNVIVHDKKGRLIEDLTKDDFTIFDKGQEQKVGYFAKDTPKTAPYSGGVAAGVATNRPPAPAEGQPPAIAVPTVILLEGMNSRFHDRANSERALMQFLSGLHTGDSVGIYVLADTLKFFRPVEPQATAKFLDDFMIQASTMGLTFQRQRVLSTLTALRTIAANLLAVPGRKNLVWLTDGFPALSGLMPSGRPGRQFESFDAEIRRTVLALDHAEVAIYPVDLRGVVSATDTAPSMTSQSRRFNRAMDVTARNYVTASEATMSDVAERTGGRAFIGSNDLSGFLQEAVADTRVTYTIAYTPSHNEWDGRFREIKVKVNRPGVEVRYRKGYFAYPEAEAEKSHAAVLAAAIESPVDASGLGIMGKVVAPPTKDHPEGQLFFIVDAHDVAFHQEGEQWILDLETTVLTRDAQSAELGRHTDPLHTALKQAEYDTIQKSGVLSLTLKFDTPANASRVKLVVRDVSTGLVGSIELPLAIQSDK